MKLLELLESMNEEANPDVKVKKDGTIYKAYLKGRVVGKAQVYDHKDAKVGDDERYIWKTAVHPDHQRKGVATAMYDVITADLKAQGLTLVPSPDNQLAPDGYQFWKDRDFDAIKGHGRHKAEAYDKHIGTELDIEGRPAVVTKIGWSTRKDVPLIFFRYTDVPEGSVNSTSVVTLPVVADQLTEDEKLELPDLETGDELMVGKFKNRKATIKGFKKDKNNQPVAKTNKGDQQIFKGRVKKLM